VPSCVSKTLIEYVDPTRRPPDRDRSFYRR